MNFMSYTWALFFSTNFLITYTCEMFVESGSDFCYFMPNQFPQIKREQFYLPQQSLPCIFHLSRYLQGCLSYLQGSKVPCHLCLVQGFYRVLITFLRFVLCAISSIFLFTVYIILFYCQQVFDHSTYFSACSVWVCGIGFFPP